MYYYKCACGGESRFGKKVEDVHFYQLRCPHCKTYGIKQRIELASTKQPLLLTQNTFIPKPQSKPQPPLQPSLQPQPTSNLDIANLAFEKAKSNSPPQPESLNVKRPREETEEHIEEMRQIYTEAKSQDVIYKILDDEGYLFYSRGSQFVKYNSALKGQMDAGCIVEEPGFHYGQPQQNLGNGMVCIGRPDVMRTQNLKFKGTYPDYYVKKDDVILAIELKTPKNSITDLIDLLNTPFQAWGDNEPSDSKRTVKLEFEQRKVHLPNDAKQVLMVDCCNISPFEDPAAVFYKVLSKDETWFKEHIHSYIFCNSKTRKSFHLFTFGELRHILDNPKGSKSKVTNLDQIGKNMDMWKKWSQPKPKDGNSDELPSSDHE